MGTLKRIFKKEKFYILLGKIKQELKDIVINQFYLIVYFCGHIALKEKYNFLLFINFSCFILYLIIKKTVLLIKFKT